MNEEYLYIGTWASGETKAKLIVLRCAHHGWEKIQELSFPGNVGCVKTDRHHRLVFVTLEEREIAGHEVYGDKQPGYGSICGGVICIFRIQDDGTAAWVKDIASGGAYPIDMAWGDTYAAVINHGSTVNKICKTRRNAEGSWETYWEYEESSLAVFETDCEGIPERLTDLYKFSGSGSIPFFQESAAPHSIMKLPKKDILMVPERGSDKTSVFRIEKGQICKLTELSAEDGEGPRNAIAADDGRDIYIMDEIEPLLTHFGSSTDLEEKKTWVLKDKISLVSPQAASGCDRNPRRFTAPHPVAIETGFDETAVYAAVRSTDTIAVFQRNTKDGTLNMIQEYPLKGKNPRELHRGKTYLYVSCMDTENLLMLHMDNENGTLINTEEIFSGIPGISSFAIYDRTEHDKSEHKRNHI